MPNANKVEPIAEVTPVSELDSLLASLFGEVTNEESKTVTLDNGFTLTLSGQDYSPSGKLTSLQAQLLVLEFVTSTGKAGSEDFETWRILTPAEVDSDGKIITPAKIRQYLGKDVPCFSTLKESTSKTWIAREIIAVVQMSKKLKVDAKDLLPIDIVPTTRTKKG